MNQPTPAVRVYMTERCPFCIAAKKLLEQRGIAFDAVDVTHDMETRMRIAEASGQRTVPQIFVHGKPIGGYQELAALDKQGLLATMINDPSV